MSPSRKDPIPNQYINRIITQKYPSLPPIIAKYPTVYESLFNDMNDTNIT